MMFSSPVFVETKIFDTLGNVHFITDDICIPVAALEILEGGKDPDIYYCYLSLLNEER